MSCVAGYKGELSVSTSGGVGTYVAVGGVVDSNLQLNIDEMECTSRDDNGARAYIPGHHDATVDMSLRWEDGDAGQDIILSAAFAKTVFYFTYKCEVLSGKKVFSGTCFATSANPSNPLDEAVSLDTTLRCSNVVMGTQA